VPTLQKQVVNRVVQLISASREDTYYGGRYSGMIIAPNMIKENPFIGIGWQNYRYQRNIPKYLGEAYERDEGDTPSNGYLQMLAETGIIGFTIFMIFLWYLLKMGILKLKQLNAYQKGWTLAMLAMWFAMLSSSYLTFHHLWVTAGLSYATIFHYRRYEMDKE